MSDNLTSQEMMVMLGKPADTHCFGDLMNLDTNICPCTKCGLLSLSRNDLDRYYILCVP